jgi:hypothetical protein
MTELPQVPAQRCKFLYCKSMVVYGEDFASDPDFQAGMTDFWCLRTSKNVGPDHDEVTMEECSLPDRPCYREF